jgi:pimeloyl-ACP methyl ester carboxylesterase
VVTVDLPGHGDSAVPHDEARLTIPAFADDVAALCETLGLGDVVLVGGG